MIGVVDEEAGTEGWVRSFYVLPKGEQAPVIVRSLAAQSAPVLVWRNQLGGQTWRLDERYLKWSPDIAVDLHREVERLQWLQGRFPVPSVLDSGHDGRGSWFLSTALPGAPAVSPRWLADPEAAISAIAEGLQRLHEADATGVPSSWESWVTRRPPALGRPPAQEDPVLVHGDACAPNTVIAPDGSFAGIVDLGDLVLGDRWADLAVASMSLDWNFGPGWQPYFFDAYGIDPDPARIQYFRSLWDTES